MELQRTTLVISVLLTISIITTPILATPSFAEAVAQQQQQTQVVHYSNSWAVEVQGGVEEADALAQKHGLINYGQIGNQRNYYLFMDGEELGEVTKDLSELMITKTGKLKAEQKVGSATQQKIVGKVKKEYTPPSDPGWSKQWSLENTGQTRGPSGLDLNVEPAWMQGITGEGVIVGIVDDGMEWRHNDLRVNYDQNASFDFVHFDLDPTPDYIDGELQAHGTQCSGIVGMANSSVCGIGVAHQANIGGLKFDVARATDAEEASALGHNDSYIDVYSNSWGPSDFGFFVSGPDTLVQNTLRTGVTEGRGGKGNIYVWAAGNGGRYFDSCAADGYVSSIYTIGVGSADQRGRQADYDEDCSAKMAVTFSYNSDTFEGFLGPYNQVYTTTVNNQCTDGFTGTSASTPLLSGVIALTLQANSDLTWRDVQYLIAYTSNPDILTGDDWVTNGGDLRVSHHFGFGTIDAEAIVTRARQWTNVPEQHTKTVFSISSSGSVYSTVSRTFVITENTFSISDRISSLEHVIVSMSLSIRGVSTFLQYDYDDLNDYEGDIYDWLEDSHPRRGDIKIELTSPQGTKSILLPYRNYDFISAEGYDDWPFMSVHFWGENPIGTWTLKITYKSGSGYVRMSGLSMTLHGTATIPTAVSSIPSVCHSSCVRGCFGEGPEHCDSCQHFRIASTLECVDQCPSNSITYKSYCFTNENATEETPTTVTPSETPSPVTPNATLTPPDTDTMTPNVTPTPPDTDTMTPDGTVTPIAITPDGEDGGETGTTSSPDVSVNLPSPGSNSDENSGAYGSHRDMLAVAVGIATAVVGIVVRF